MMGESWPDYPQAVRLKQRRLSDLEFVVSQAGSRKQRNFRPMLSLNRGMGWENLKMLLKHVDDCRNFFLR